MPDGSEPVTVKVLSGVDEIAAAEWDACAGPDLAEQGRHIPKVLDNAP